MFCSFFKEPMTRFLCFPLLFVLALPVISQDTLLPGSGRALVDTEASTLPRDPALLMRMREQISRELQNTLRMLSYVNPNDTQLVETLTTQQTELSKQLREISEQMQSGTPPTQFSSMPSSRDVPQDMFLSAPPTERQGITQMMSQLRERQTLEPMIPSQNSARMPPSVPEMPVPLPQDMNRTPPVIPMYNLPVYGGQNWADQDRAWEATPWGPRLPKELTDMKQSIDSLQKEVGELKDTIKALETQIQLLSRNILLNEKVKENGN